MTEADGTLAAALAETWPAEEILRESNLLLRKSAGGGKRVSAASVIGDRLSAADLLNGEQVMRAWGQTPLFTLRSDQGAVDRMLETKGYGVVDRTIYYQISVSKLAPLPSPPVTCYDIWPPLAIMKEMWAEAGIGTDRLAVMGRVQGPKTALFGRQNDQPAGVGFLAASRGVAMLHALEIRPDQRRQGLARCLMGHAGRWAGAGGCHTLALAVTEANHSARALYMSLGMTEADGYHYRIAPARPER